uniref:dnaJ homolog subfamily C member 8-like isoform X2 n=2 Tax=Myxine glutinosa TaxID=7769 RepID=UPI00358F9B60
MAETLGRWHSVSEKSQKNESEGKKEEGNDNDAFSLFYTEVKQIEKRDSVLTPVQQIARLTRPGSTYINLNPYEVLQIDPEVSMDDIKKRFRQLSILVHPDKNQECAIKAQQAFEAVDRAYKSLQDEETRQRCQEVLSAARETVDRAIKERKKQLKKEGKPQMVPEEQSQEAYRVAVNKQTMKLFADLEVSRRQRDARDMHERKRQREEELAEDERTKKEKEWEKNFELKKIANHSKQDTYCFKDVIKNTGTKN